MTLFSEQITLLYNISFIKRIPTWISVKLLNKCNSNM